jgi:sortase B
MKKLIYGIAIIALIGVFGISTWKIISVFAAPKSNADLLGDRLPVIDSTIVETLPSADTETAETEEIEETEPSVEETEPVVIITPEMQAVTAWKEINNDVIGSITIQELDNEPIVQTENQNEYLRKDILGNYFQAGTLFSSEGSILGETKTTTIFGHSMSSGAMFGNLKKFKELDYLKSNPTFTVSSEYATYNCKIVGVLLPSANYKANGWYYADADLTEEEFENFRFQVRARSLFVIEDEFDYDSNYILMSTCSYACDNERLVIVARIMEDGETVDTSNWCANPVVLRCVEWYAKNGKNQPSWNTLYNNYENNYNK